jgi:hypothetical protein
MMCHFLLSSLMYQYQFDWYHNNKNYYYHTVL